MEKCEQVISKDYIYVATEDDEIKDFVKKIILNVLSRGPAKTAIDRIKLFSDKIKNDSYKRSRDEPIVNINDIKSLLNYNLKFPDRVVFGKTTANEMGLMIFQKQSCL